eukprot:Awhi_evm1s3382
MNRALWHLEHYFKKTKIVTGKNGNKCVCVKTTLPDGSRQEISYSDTKVIGNGSFGVVYQAKYTDSGEAIAIKKVLQDKRFKVHFYYLLANQLHVEYSLPHDAVGYSHNCKNNYTNNTYYNHT